MTLDIAAIAPSFQPDPVPTQHLLLPHTQLTILAALTERFPNGEASYSLFTPKLKPRTRNIEQITQTPNF